jgi:acyl-CoA synthetase (AMP-forming)/AMP-acid ligase II
MHQILLERAAAEYPRADPPRLRFIRSCSAPLAPAVFRQLEAQFSAPVVPAYGMTETAHQATSNPLPESGPVKPGSVGIGTGVELQIVGPNGQVVAPGAHGEICVRGPAVASGYLDDPNSRPTPAAGSARRGHRSASFSSPSFRLRRRRRAIAENWQNNSALLELISLLPATVNSGLLSATRFLSQSVI